MTESALTNRSGAFMINKKASQRKPEDDPEVPLTMLFYFIFL
jgi:hypothetical protein